MVWYGDFVRNGTYNSLDLWKKLFASDYVITLDEMPNLKTYTTGTAIIEKKEMMNVYPTRFVDSFTVATNKIPKNITVYNQFGVKIKTLLPTDANTVISLAGCPTGIYFVVSEGYIATKVIKK
jgi:mannan endo-1,4-beta-mannosidase